MNAWRLRAGPIALLAVTLAVALGLAWASRPQAANPALWEVTGQGGARGYLFGTIHALDRPARWRTPRVDAALGASDRIVVEVAGLDDEATLGAAFERLAHSPGQPPLAARLAPSQRGRLAAVLKEAGMGSGEFAATETWAAALTLAQALRGSEKPCYGVDRAVIAAADGRPVIEFEGAARQFAIFDGLAEADQRDLLAAVVSGEESEDRGAGGLAAAWRAGDMARIERETRTGMLADPGLRAALFTGRNRAWGAAVAAMLARGQRPFVAVGAAHMAGSEGLPALLGARGLRVRRIE